MVTEIYKLKFKKTFFIENFQVTKKKKTTFTYKIYYIGIKFLGIQIPLDTFKEFFKSLGERIVRSESERAILVEFIKGRIISIKNNRHIVQLY